MQKLLRFIKKLLPSPLFIALQPVYHYLLAFFSALLYRFPSRHIHVIGVTGTKGKTTTSEIVAELLIEDGLKVALSNTYRFRIGDKTTRNLHKMTMPGRFFVQRLIRKAVNAGCDWVVLEMTSEGAKQFRHKFIALDALIFTNLSPEHVEAHGSFEKYRDTKRKIGSALEKSHKKNRVIVSNADDREGKWYLGLGVKHSFPYSMQNAEPFEKTSDGHVFTFRNTLVNLYLPGTFNLYNALAASTFAVSQNIEPLVIKRGLEKIKSIRGRVEFIQHEPFTVVVDNAHTKDSLKQFYGVFQNTKNICVLGKMGGGRDKWSRTEMAAVSDEHCDYIILTNEDPCDEDPRKIV